MSTENLEVAIASTRAVLANVRPDQYSLPTPCASWDVKALVNHLVVEAPPFFISACRGEPPSGGSDELAPESALAAYDQAYAETLAAFQAPGVLESILKPSFGEIPAMAFLGVAANDVFVHGWDLAKATNQSTDLNPGLAEFLVQFASTAIQDSFRGPEGAPFGPEQQAPGGAAPADRLAAFLGRRI